MPLLETTPLSADVIALNREQCIEAGTRLHAQYINADPFPHIAIEDFIDKDVLRRLLAEWPVVGRDKKYYNRAQERLKYEWQPHELYSPALRSFLAEMNAEPMVRFIEALTGIKRLIADPYYDGAGLHEIKRGGHLGIHADFNIHKGMNTQRRVNLLIYLNEDWAPEYGGDLELWTKDMSGVRRKVAPRLGTAVIFNTDLDSFHGHPDPLACPPDRSRRSIALYYYTAPEEGIKYIPSRTTAFKSRPGSTDKRDWHVEVLHFFQDWMPPALLRLAKRKAE
ncbi:MAG TPA: 2OG-Fe(II) oxygenase [Rhizomicrobium sp.]|nr:2OG-Fe(II) oxygenase [Rhizomicrobium sp.]